MIDNLKTGDTVQLAVRPNDERLNPSARKRGLGESVADARRRVQQWAV
jgi:hypothetical protein